MAEMDTLLAYLAPKHARSVEDVATDALAYILNKSEDALESFNGLVAKTAGVTVEDCVRFETQVVAPDQSRPDFVGYDGNGEKRIIGESKFWAGLGEGQGKAYVEQLSSSGPAVLLFVVPDTKIDTLWDDVNRDVGREAQPHDKIADENLRMGVIPDNELSRIMMVGWVNLLDRLRQATTGNPDVASDIRQLQGLAEQQDREAFLPLKREELAPEFPRRLRSLVDLIDEVIYEYGAKEGWLDTRNLQARSQYYGYGRYFRVSGVEGSLWFGLNHDLWATREKSPFWLWFSASVLDKRRARLQVELCDEWDGTWTPIYLKTDADRDVVLKNVVSQLKAIAGAVKGTSQGS